MQKLNWVCRNKNLWHWINVTHWHWGKDKLNDHYSLSLEHLYQMFWGCYFPCLSSVYKCKKMPLVQTICWEQDLNSMSYPVFFIDCFAFSEWKSTISSLIYESIPEPLWVHKHRAYNFESYELSKFWNVFLQQCINYALLVFTSLVNSSVHTFLDIYGDLNKLKTTGKLSQALTNLQDTEKVKHTNYATV